MNEIFYEKGNKVYVLDQNKLVRQVDNKNNIEDILNTENNIENIENELKNLNDVTFKKNWDEIIIYPAVGLLIASIFTIPMIAINDVAVKLVSFLCSLKFLIMSGIVLKDRIKVRNSIIKKKTELLNLEKEEELKKLKILKMTAQDKTVEFTEPKKISKSEEIEKLKNKLDLIQHYFNNKNEFNDYYISESLYELKRQYNYNDDDVEFIKFLIEENLNKDDKKTKEKTDQKVKKLKK